MGNSDTINSKKIEKILREKRQCNEINCEKGDFNSAKIPGGTIIICQGCMNPGENFGHPMVMPKGFTINPAK